MVAGFDQYQVVWRIVQVIAVYMVDIEAVAEAFFEPLLRAI